MLRHPSAKMKFELFFAGSILAAPLVSAQIPPVVPETGVAAHPFDMSQVSLTDGRFMDNQKRTLNYLKAVDVERLLYNFRATHKLSTNGAAKNGGWDAPDFPFRYVESWECSLGDSLSSARPLRREYKKIY